MPYDPDSGVRVLVAWSPCALVMAAHEERDLRQSDSSSFILRVSVCGKPRGGIRTLTYVLLFFAKKNIENGTDTRLYDSDLSSIL